MLREHEKEVLADTVESIIAAHRRGFERWITSFLKLRCLPDLLTHVQYPNAKEVAESMAVVKIAKSKLGVSPDERSVVCLCPGDGTQPRTGALFAYTTAWTVISIDPALRAWANKGRHIGAIKRLHVLTKKVEDVLPEEVGSIYASPEYVVIAAPHSHASTSRTLDLVRAVYPEVRKVGVVLMPCCVSPDIPREPDGQVVSRGVFSPKNRVMWWVFE